MKISEIVKKEANNAAIILHREGIFWRAYEVSGYLFVEHIKQYDVKIRYYKKIRQNIVFIGFPDTVLNSIIDRSKSSDYKVQKDR